jgi:hypothetical protein
LTLNHLKGTIVGFYLNSFPKNGSVFNVCH